MAGVGGVPHPSPSHLVELESQIRCHMVHLVVVQTSCQGLVSSNAGGAALPYKYCTVRGHSSDVTSNISFTLSLAVKVEVGINDLKE